MASCFIRGSTRIGDGYNSFCDFYQPCVDQLIEHLATILSKFADDTNTGRAVINDRQLLQEVLDTLVKWTKIGKYRSTLVNVKLYTLVKTISSIVYTMGGNAPAGTILESTSAEKDLIRFS